MIIDGVNISTFGLKVSSMDGDCSFPGRKAVLQDPGYAEKDIVLQGKEIKMLLYGKYTSLALLRAGVDAFYAHIKATHVHAVSRPAHNLVFNGVIANGIKADNLNNVITLSFTITVVE